MRIFQLLFLLLIGYILYKVVKFFFNLSRGASEARRRMEENRDRMRKGGKNEGGKVIELDKDQYKVD